MTKNMPAQLSDTVHRLSAPMPARIHGHSPTAGLHRLRTLAVLEAQLEIAKREYVGMARAQNEFTPVGSTSATWQAIGDALGITKQAAQQRYGHDLQVPRDLSEPSNSDLPY